MKAVKKLSAKAKQAKADKIFAAIEAANKTLGAQKMRRKTEDGYNIYSMEELGLGTTGGDTAECPFDCQCCF